MIRDGAWTRVVTRLRGTLRRVPVGSRPLVILDALAKSFSIVEDLPTWVQVETTNRCNFSCTMCPRNVHELPATDMPLSMFTRVLDRLSLPEGSLITLFGLGEPLMHPDIFSMVEQVRRRGYRAAFTTNGVLLTDAVIERILSSGLSSIRISVDDDEFGSAGGVLHRAASRVMEHTRLLVARRAGPAPEVLWNVVASAASVPTIPRLIASAAQIGVDGVNIINLVPRFSTLAPVPEDRRALLFREWHLQGRRLGVRVLSTFGDRFGLPRFFHGGGLECPSVLSYAYVTMDGDVTPCCHLPRLAMGNLFEASLREIWHGERFRRFRRTYRTSRTCRECRLLTWH